MNFFQILACDSDLVSLLRIVRFVLTAVCVAVPIILIVMATMDVAKVVTTGNLDDKIKKEATQKLVTRVIFGVIIMLIPTIVSVVFRILPVETAQINGVNWKTCWDEAGN